MATRSARSFQHHLSQPHSFVVAARSSYLDFTSAREARDFLRGYCVLRVLVDTRGCRRRPRCAHPLGRYLIVTEATAKKQGWPVIARSGRL